MKNPKIVNSQDNDLYKTKIYLVNTEENPTVPGTDSNFKTTDVGSKTPYHLQRKTELDMFSSTDSSSSSSSESSNLSYLDIENDHNNIKKNNINITI